jgi:hypothetical protein
MNTVRIFLAAPMSAFASDEEYRLHREIVGRVCEHLERDGGVSVYFAGRHISESAGFDDPAAAFRADFDALITCDLFVLYYPGPIRSSVLVEVGMAIGRGKPCLIVPARRDDLVFLLKQAENETGMGEIPPIVIREFGAAAPTFEALADFIAEALDSFRLVPLARPSGV